MIPAGVHLESWAVNLSRAAPVDPPIRLLFVGGDFTRKGGDMLLEFMRSDEAADFELHIVTRHEVESGGRTHVHRFEPNDPGLRSCTAVPTCSCCKHAPNASESRPLKRLPAVSR